MTPRVPACRAPEREKPAGLRAAGFRTLWWRFREAPPQPRVLFGISNLRLGSGVRSGAASVTYSYTLIKVSEREVRGGLPPRHAVAISQPEPWVDVPPTPEEASMRCSELNGANSVPDSTHRGQPSPLPGLHVDRISSRGGLIRRHFGVLGQAQPDGAWQDDGDGWPRDARIAGNIGIPPGQLLLVHLLKTEVGRAPWSQFSPGSMSCAARASSSRSATTLVRRPGCATHASGFRLDGSTTTLLAAGKRRSTSRVRHFRLETASCCMRGSCRRDTSTS